jgi:hypothetical protein
MRTFSDPTLAVIPDNDTGFAEMELDYHWVNALRLYQRVWVSIKQAADVSFNCRMLNNHLLTVDR